MKTRLVIKISPKVSLYILFLLIFLNAPCAKAEQLTFVCKGYVNGVTHALEDHFSVGDLFTLEYTIDTETPDYNYRDPDKGLYQDSVIKISIRIEEYVATSKGITNISVVNNDPDGADRYQLQLSDPLIGETINHCLVPSRLSSPVSLYDSSGTALDNDSLITNPPDLTRFSGHMGISFETAQPCMPGTSETVYADISSIEVIHSDLVCQSDIEGEDGDMDGADLAVLAMDLSSAIIEDFACSFGGSVCRKSPSVWHGYYVIIDSTDIQKLKKYTRITNGLYISDASELTSLRGLENLKKNRW